MRPLSSPTFLNLKKNRMVASCACDCLKAGRGCCGSRYHLDMTTKPQPIAAEIPLEPGVDELFRVVPGFHQYLANIGTSDDENRMSIFKDLIVSLFVDTRRRDEDAKLTIPHPRDESGRFTNA